MGKEYNTFVGLGGRNDLPRAWEPVRDIRGQVSGFPKLRDVLLRNGGGHPLASRSGHVQCVFAEKMRTWVLELVCARMDVGEEEGVGKKEESLSLYKGGRNCVPPHFPGKTCLFPKRRD